MDNKQVLIPSKIRVGFQKREDTYTKKLAYVIYYDTKGKLRKEGSWESWRDKTIDPVEYENIPTEGFVLNKNVGGYKSYWNYRSAHIRVYDPRDFEFEISLENLLYILSCGDCTRGKGLEGKFVYAWDGTELVLLPENSETYKVSVSYTSLQNLTIRAKTLVPGHSYITKKQEILVYIGKLDKYSNYKSGWRPDEHVTKLHVFWNVSDNDWSFHKDMKNLAAVHSDVVVSNYAELRSSYHNSEYGTPVKSLEIVKLNKELGDKYHDTFFAYLPKHGIVKCTHYSHKKDFVITDYIVQVVNGRIEEERFVKESYKFGKPPESRDFWGRPFDRNQRLDFWIEPEATTLKITLESGTEFFYKSYGQYFCDLEDSKLDTTEEE